MTGTDAAPASQVTGAAVQLMIRSISATIMPSDQLDPDQVLPTSLFVDLFGPEEDWRIRGQEVGAGIIRAKNLRGSTNPERVTRVIVEWLRENHPDAQEVEVIESDYRAVVVVLRLDYPREFLLGIMQRTAWETQARDAEADEDDDYRFRISL